MPGLYRRLFFLMQKRIYAQACLYRNKLKNELRININRLCIYMLCLIVAAFPNIFIPRSSLALQNFCPFEIDKLINKKAPDFTLLDLRGNAVTLSSFKGNIVVLNFWARWCPTCIKEQTYLNMLSSMYEKDGIVVLSVAMEKQTTLMDFINNKNLNFRMLIDDKLIVSSTLYKVFMAPTTFIIDKKGFIVKIYFGQQDWLDKKKAKELKDLLMTNNHT